MSEADSDDDTETIFVSVAAYRDPLLGFTLKSAWSQAARPQRVSFGVIDQQPAGTHARSAAAWVHEHVRHTRVDAGEALGPCWARALAMALWRGERWWLQVDSHTWFEPGWDTRLVRHAKALQAAHGRRVILGAYPNPFTLHAGQPRAHAVTQRVLAHVVAEGQAFDAAHPVLRFECVPVETDTPVPAMHVAAGAMFAPGEICDALPYDPRLYFHGEEQAFALRAWTHGWSLWHVPALPLYHHYTAHRPAAAGPADAPAPDDVPRPMHWEADARRPLPRGAGLAAGALEAAARARLAALLWHGADLGAYGLGRARSLADYAAFSGIDYAARQIAPHAFKARFGHGATAASTPA